MSILTRLPFTAGIAARMARKPRLFAVVRGGQMRLLMAEGWNVVWHRVIPLNPAYLEGGMIAQPRAVAAAFRAAIEQSPNPNVKEGVGAVAGYHALASIIDVPRARDARPDQIIPREARRVFSYRPDSSTLSWWEVKTPGRVRRYLFVVTRRAAVQSLRDLFTMAGLDLAAVDSGPLAAARAANLEEGIVVQAEADGGDVVVIKSGAVGIVRSAFWGDAIIDQDTLAARLTDLVERAVAAHNESNPMGPLGADAPVLVSGAGADLLEGRLAGSMGRPEGSFDTPVTLPPDFPLAELAANIGMVMRGKP